ncbi:MAG: methyltransferase domain-containing protein, partial [Micromonosporaceae bacterium]|nr:methyltransferase domain-containing protein [Micromonosporaceae bacterium]
SGYRAYSVKALSELPLQYNHDDFDFDTQIIIQLLHAGKRIKEIPIPTYYGDEICYVNGLRYAKDVIKDVLVYRLARKGLGAPAWVTHHSEYVFKDSDGSSHSAIIDMLPDHPPCRILDVGCSGGLLAERIRRHGHWVTGIDVVKIPGVRDRTDEFHLVDLTKSIPEQVGRNFDFIIAGDIIEHLPEPAHALRNLARLLRPGGQILLSVPNFGHWYPRFRTATGLFGYDRRGILDNSHLRFFTRATLRRMIKGSGFDILEERTTGLPIGSVAQKPGSHRWAVRQLDRLLVRIRPTLFAYQFVVRLTQHAMEAVVVESD